MDEKQRKIEFIALLKKAARHYPDAPNFDDKDTIVDWGGALYPHADKVTPLFIHVLAHFDRWPSVRKILDMIGETPKTNVEIAKEAAANIWAHMETHIPLTPLADRVFNALGGMHKLGNMQFDYTARRTYDLLFNQKALELITESANNLLPRLPEPKVPANWTPEALALKEIIDKREIEGRRKIYGHDTPAEPYDVRRKPFERGETDFYEPPRHHEMPIGYQMNPDDKKMWAKKIAMRVKEVMQMVSAK